MCTKDYTLPGTSVLVERGTIVLFPTLGIQRDERSCLVRLLQRVRISPARASMLAERRAEPFAPDPRSPLTLHPADSLVEQMKCCLARLLQRLRREYRNAAAPDGTSMLAEQFALTVLFCI
ncbi:Cytochrome P450 6d5, partial [Operophtera brumata]